MIHRFLRKLKVLWPPALTNLGKPKTIQSEAYSMPRKQANYEEESLFRCDKDAPEPVPSLSPQTQNASQPTEKAHKSITVVCACIMREGDQEILLSMRRAPGVIGLDGKWELPGGKVEFGETPEQAIVSEIREELGIRIAPRRLLPYLHTNRWEYEHAIQHVILALPGTREFVSLAARNDWFDKVYIEFEFVDSSANASKRFAVATQSTLFSRYGLVKYWGRVGVKPRTKWQEFGSPRELDKQIFETAKRCLADGYHIRVLKGPDRPAEVLTRIRELALQWNEYSPASERASGRLFMS